MLTWDELAARALARQFPGPDAAAQRDGVAGLLRAVGPIQSQTARSTFLGLAARRPGVTCDEITAAHESFALVRGSSLRGTVHTSDAALHPLLEAATRTGQRALWARTLRLSAVTLEQVWAGIERYAEDQWRTASELAAHLLEWLAVHDPGAQPRFPGTSGRYFAFGHGGLLRRPLTGDWAGQGRPGYRTAASVLGDADARAAVLADADAALDALFTRQLAASGPLSRNDLAWWSGVGLTRVDAALARLDVLTETGPDGRRYHDLPHAPPPVTLTGLRLLPEFDALLCSYDPAGRERFVDREGYQLLWRQENGLLLAPVLVGNRLAGSWRLTGTGRRRNLHVTLFEKSRIAGAPRVDEAASGLEAALGVRIGTVEID